MSSPPATHAGRRVARSHLRRVEIRCACLGEEQRASGQRNSCEGLHTFAVRATNRYPLVAIRDPTTFRLVDLPRHPSCDTCGAMVPTSLMGFHVEWHAANDGHGTRFFEEAAEEQPSLEQLLSVIAALRAVPKVSARPEFVATLRERLTELPHRRSSTRQGSPR